MGMSAMERVYGYTGGCGMIQGLAAGYFLWDLVVTSRNVGIFGWGMWAHAVCALCVFSFGFVRQHPKNPSIQLYIRPQHLSSNPGAVSMLTKYPV